MSDADVRATERPAAFVNPYEGDRSLSPAEQELLGEYARLAGTVRRVASLSSQLASSSTHASMLAELRVIERKMGLVLTLFKASVWAIVMQQEDAQEAQELDELELQYEQLPMPSDGVIYEESEPVDETQSTPE